MNETAAPHRLSALLALVLALVLAGCAGERPEPPLKDAAMGGAFQLTGPDGSRVSSDRFAGSYRLVYFGFTFCPDVCPTDLQTIGAAMRELERSDPEVARRVQPIFITVDPVRDTPEAMRRYTANFHPRILGLTGSEEEIGRVARSHAVFFTRGDPDEAGDYTVDHSRMVVLYGPGGEPIAIIPHERGPAALAADVRRWVQ